MSGPGRILGQSRKRASNGDARASSTTNTEFSEHPLPSNGTTARRRLMPMQSQSLNTSQAANSDTNGVAQEHNSNSIGRLSRSAGANSTLPHSSSSQIPQDASEDDTQGSNLPKRTRGPTRGLGLEKFNKNNQRKMLIEIAHGKGRPIAVDQSAKLSSELGVISRKFMPIPTQWNKLSDDSKDHACERLQSKFQIDLNDDYVKKSVKSILKNLTKNQRYKLHLYYKSFDSDEEARRNIPTKVNMSDENWKELCDMWKDKKFQERCKTNAENRSKCKWSHNQGSRAFVVSRAMMSKDNEEPDRIEFFKKTHYCEETKTWRSTEAENAYTDMQELQEDHGPDSEEPLSVDEIVDRVLGKKTGYIKGLGYGPKPASHEASNNAAQARNVVLERALQNAEAELASVKGNFTHLIQALKNSGNLPEDFTLPISPAQASNDQFHMNSSPSNDGMD